MQLIIETQGDCQPSHRQKKLDTIQKKKKNTGARALKSWDFFSVKTQIHQHT